ncbi:hypothetical protein NDU88_003114 [Pleurodeles waltl]|uniref:Uncharacterized protein n=1 Tax=Pleurodeles waltl TaxID=8319 RepID=A0AAV7SCV2_PLEWA|nr:hypothetical protein NDU88_003114 [Pleurodeles waltl]
MYNAWAAGGLELTEEDLAGFLRILAAVTALGGPRKAGDECGGALEGNTNEDKLERLCCFAQPGRTVAAPAVEVGVADYKARAQLRGNLSTQANTAMRQNVLKIKQSKSRRPHTRALLLSSEAGAADGTRAIQVGCIQPREAFRF